MDRPTLEEIARLMDREATRQDHEAHRLVHAHGPGSSVMLDPGKGEFEPDVVRSTRLILSNFCRDLARDIRSLID